MFLLGGGEVENVASRPSGQLVPNEVGASGLPAHLHQITQVNAVQPVSKPIPGSYLSIIWFCTASVQDEEFSVIIFEDCVVVIEGYAHRF